MIGSVRKAEVGTTLVPGSPIFQMVDLKQIWLAAWIDQALVAQLRVGQPAKIMLRSGREFQGQVARINQEGDTVTRELEVDVKFDKLPKPLVIGEEGQVEIDTGRQRAPVVPLSAIISKSSGKGVLVASNGLLRFRKVHLGLQDGARTAVTQGLKPGELVVLKPAGLKPGKKIRPKIKQAVPRT